MLRRGPGSCCRLERLGKTTTHLVARAYGRRAASGVPIGGGTAIAEVLVTVFGLTLSGWQTGLLAQPALWTMACLLLTRGRVRAHVGATLLAAARPGSRVKEALRKACSAS
ncbi:hypothetical protein GCM10010168_42080 [Actinoplanes ianthinogenes]|uniref:Uncharacterized protein n=1 Tax=Actinoplanes ianthinogenes TaxID=122358 RepID=A0ABM7LVX5_9ACTN|nr:hypothetical protein Aiant_41390 [Actinoplanes ianthinogenes]GGR19810.1 hypothetical protein GCM10010168_42080 [Actinoplanes ianthinogenes]